MKARSAVVRSNAPVDAFVHLDLTAPDPVRDIAARLAAAGLGGALLVETWSGRDRTLLEACLSQGDPAFRYVFCFRADSNPADLLVGNDAVLGVRIRGSELAAAEPVLALLAESDKTLVVHSDQGIGPLAADIEIVASRFPALPIYVPHLAWPVADGVPDADWDAALERIHRIAGVLAGISAIAHFSRDPFPHPDVSAYAGRLLEIFEPERVLVAGGYPLADNAAYPRYIRLARDWISRRHPQWTSPWSWPAGLED